MNIIKTDSTRREIFLESSNIIGYLLNENNKPLKLRIKVIGDPFFTTRGAPSLTVINTDCSDIQNVIKGLENLQETCRILLDELT